MISADCTVCDTNSFPDDIAGVTYHIILYRTAYMPYHLAAKIHSLAGVRYKIQYI